MIILSIRTDQAESEIALFKDQTLVGKTAWLAHRTLADTINLKIADLLNDNQLGLHDTQAVICYKGPGSFTGLRIGLTVANALASALRIPIIASTGDNWQLSAIGKLLAGENDRIALPEYGAEVRTTQPKK